MSIEEVQNLVSFRCSYELATHLLKAPSEENIRNTIAAMPKSKAHGPNGFPVAFLWEAWDVVGLDIVKAVQSFFTSGYLPRNFNTTAITLIPKVQGADKVSQFRPISCCTTMYKIIARLLNRSSNCLFLILPKEIKLDLFRVDFFARTFCWPQNW